VLHDGPPYANGDLHMGKLGYYDELCPFDTVRQVTH